MAYAFYRSSYHALAQSILFSLLLINCVSQPIELKALEGTEPQSSKTWSCEKASTCSGGSTVTQICQGNYFGRKIVSWGDNQCEAEENLRKKACSQNLDLKSLKDITCNPDSTGGECPTKRRFCTFEFRPTKCAATSYNGTKLEVLNRPASWASNPCQAKIKLNEKICNMGLVPSSMDDIKCLPEKNPGQCPPKECAGGLQKPKRCTLNKVSGNELAEAWEEDGQNECEARYKILYKACLSNVLLEEEQVIEQGDIQCQTL